MSTFEKQSTGTDYNDRDSHQQRTHDDRDNHRERDSHQQHAGLPTAVSVMRMWTVASYDYAEQVLKAQRQFAHSMLGAGAPTLDSARDVMSPDANQGRPANNQLQDARSNQRHEGSPRSRENERYDDDTAGYNKRSVDNNTSDDYPSDISRTEHGNTQAEESAKTGTRGAASAPGRKLP
jgi:hypothetical protein